ncbi:aldehyde dehydrogenase family protein [Klebsiella quasipneumoniae]|uniref:aldehyde dehydrogenase family protein n=1 Tax=Klebsiella quasipneumoniae TaxID=1463165 RepID=UPI001C97E257|nr:aldehyde dehydrogenase family protein [Klebsiella quasipneumoniae]HCT5903732.1 aldehyde dehydrogenase family protein [Klebsiella pneumoniae]
MSETEVTEVQPVYINGQWVQGKGKPMMVFEPATTAPFATVSTASAEDVDEAVSAARAAFPGWRDTPSQERARMLRGFAQQLECRRAGLLEIQIRNNGKPRHEAELDLNDAIATFLYYADLAERLDAQQETDVELSSPGYSARLRHEALGVVALIVPWNFPLVTSAWKIAPALAAGCTIVLKTSEITPLAELEYGVIAEALGLPPGVLNILSGDGESGRLLSQHPDIDKLSFTGSTAIGSRVMTAAAKRCLPVTLELGGKSPIIVFEDCDLDQAVEWIMAGITWNAGQMCSATSRLLIQEGIAEALYSRLATAMQGLKVGDPRRESVDMGPLTSEAQWHKVQSYFAVARDERLSCLAGGISLSQAGWFVAPTLYADVPVSSRLWREEIFGPVLCGHRFTDEAEAIQLANHSDYGLVATVVSADNVRARRIAKALDVGHVWINSVQSVFVETSWGGTKGSGIGRELGPWGLASYQSVKHVVEAVSTARIL